MGPAVLEHEYAHEVDQEPQYGHHQQPLVLHLGRLHKPLNGLNILVVRSELQV